MQFKAHAIIIAPLFGLLAACGSSTDPQSGQTVAQLFSSEARAEGTVAPAPTQTVARGRGPKSKTKIDTGRTAAPADAGETTAPCATLSLSGDAAMQRRGPKSRDGIMTNRTAQTGDVEPESSDQAGRHRGPKGGGRDKIDTGRTAAPSTDAAAAAPCPAPAETPDAARRGGPKGGGRDKILTN